MRERERELLCFFRLLSLPPPLLSRGIVSVSSFAVEYLDRVAVLRVADYDVH